MLDHLAGFAAIVPAGISLGGMRRFALVSGPLAKLPADVASGSSTSVSRLLSFAMLTVLAALYAFGPVGDDRVAPRRALLIFAHWWLMPRINRVCDASKSAAGAARFARLRRASLLINTTQMVALLVVLIRRAEEHVL